MACIALHALHCLHCVTCVALHALRGMDCTEGDRTRASTGQTWTRNASRFPACSLVPLCARLRLYICVYYRVPYVHTSPSTTTDPHSRQSTRMRTVTTAGRLGKAVVGLGRRGHGRSAERVLGVDFSYQVRAPCLDPLSRFPQSTCKSESESPAVLAARLLASTTSVCLSPRHVAHAPCVYMRPLIHSPLSHEIDKVRYVPFDLLRARAPIAGPAAPERSASLRLLRSSSSLPTTTTTSFPFVARWDVARVVCAPGKCA